MSHWVAEASHIVSEKQLYTEAFDSKNEAISAIANRHPLTGYSGDELLKYGSTIVAGGPEERAILIDVFYCVCQHRDSHTLGEENESDQG